MNLLSFKSWPEKWRRWTVRFAAAFVVYSLAGFFLIPVIVKWQLMKRLRGFTKRQAAIRQVRMNPWTLSLTIRGLALTEPDGRVFASWEEFYINFQLSSLFRWTWTLKEIHLNDFFGEAILQKDGRFNFANMFESTNAPPPQPPGESALPRVLVFDLSVTNSHVGFDDRSRKTPFHTDYQPINFHLRRFTTRPDSQSPYSFEAAGDTGRRLSWAGIITAQPAASSGAFRVTGVPLPKFAPYVEDFTRAQLADGTLDVSSSYRFALGTNGMDLVVSNLEVTVRSVQLLDPDTRETVLAVPSYELRDGALDWQARRVRIGSLVVTEPAATVRRRADGSMNLPSLVLRRITTAPSQTNAPAAAPWIFTLDDYRLERGSIEIEDDTVPGPFRTLLKPVSLRIEHFTTAPDSDAALQAEVTTEASESVNLAASYSINPIRAGGTLKVAGLELKKYEPYLRPFFRGQLAAGKTDVTLEFHHHRTNNVDHGNVSNAVVRVSDLQVQSPDGGETLLSVPAFAIENASASLVDLAARAGLVKTTGGSILARRNADGSLNLLSLLPTNTAPTTTRTPAPASTNQAGSPSAPWTVFLDEIAVENYAVKCEDKVPPKPATVKLDQLAVNLKGFSTVSNAPVIAALSVRINEGGFAALGGTARLAPQTADFEVGVTNLDLRALQPYVDQHAKLGISSGAFAMHGRVIWQPSDTNSPSLQFKGGLSITNLLTTDQSAFEEFVEWNSLGVDGIDFSMQPERLQIETVRLDGFKTSLLIGPDKQPNLAAIFPKQTNGVPAATTPAPVDLAPRKSPIPFPVSLGTLSLSNAALHFEDASIEPHCQFGVQQFSGAIKGLSSDAAATAEVDFMGRVDEQSSFAITGKGNPLAQDLALNLTLTNRNLQLTTFTPYMEKYGGHPLNRGRLSLNLHYDLQGKELKAQNQVQIDQLMLGPRNESPDATKLPVKLAVALLKDRNGRIDLDVPVAGRLDDPQFRVGPIILKVVSNLIAKVAASPFKLLGALVGGGEELSFIEFEPGDTNWLEGETNKLEKITRALGERPAVNLEIEGSMDPRLDRDALARKTVRASIKTQRLQELAAVGQTPSGAAESFQVEPAEYERLLRAAVVKQFGTNLSDAVRALAADKSTNQPPARAASAPKKKQGLIGRVVDLWPFHKKDSPAGASRQQAKADAALLKQNPELATMPPEVMEMLLASKTEVPGDTFLKLMQDRAQAVQKELLKGGQLTAERLFLIAPKAARTDSQGQARVNLSLN